MAQMSVVAGIAAEPSAEDKSNSNTNSHAYSYACTDAVYCHTDTRTDSKSAAKCKNPQVIGNIRFGFSATRFLFQRSSSALREGLHRLRCDIMAPNPSLDTKEAG